MVKKKVAQGVWMISAATKMVYHLTVGAITE